VRPPARRHLAAVLADSLKEFFLNADPIARLIDDGVKPTEVLLLFFQQMLNAAFSEVDWYEIAERGINLANDADRLVADPEKKTK